MVEDQIETLEDFLFLDETSSTLYSLTSSYDLFIRTSLVNYNFDVKFDNLLSSNLTHTERLAKHLVNQNVINLATQSFFAIK